TQHARSLAVHVAGTAARADQDLHCTGAEQGVDDAAHESGESVQAAVRSVRAVPEQSAEEPPKCVSAETDRDEDQQYFPEPLVCDRLQRTLLVRRRAAYSDGELDREDPNDPVDQPARDEPGS